MILADTSIWIDHLRSGDRALQDLLDRNQILIHPLVIGELAMGNLRNRESIISMLRDLPSAVVATDAEVHAYVAHNRLFGRGVGFMDAHLLASTLLTGGTLLWTRDKRLNDVARELRVSIECE